MNTLSGELIVQYDRFLKTAIRLEAASDITDELDKMFDTSHEFSEHDMYMKNIYAIKTCHKSITLFEGSLPPNMTVIELINYVRRSKNANRQRREYELYSWR